jgi:hypothetical protein
MPTVVRPTRRPGTAGPSTRPEPSAPKKAARKKSAPKPAAPKRTVSKARPGAEAKAAVRTAKPKRPAPPPDHPLVGWAALAGKPTHGSARKRPARASVVDAIPTLRFAVLVLIACGALVMYVGHLYASQALVEEVQAMQREQSRLVLQQNRLRGEFDRATEPTVILDRAAALGLRPANGYAPTLIME